VKVKHNLLKVDNAAVSQLLIRFTVGSNYNIACDGEVRYWREGSQDVEECALASAGRAHDGCQLSTAELSTDTVQDLLLYSVEFIPCLGGVGDISKCQIKSGPLGEMVLSNLVVIVRYLLNLRAFLQARCLLAFSHVIKKSCNFKEGTSQLAIRHTDIFMVHITHWSTQHLSPSKALFTQNSS